MLLVRVTAPHELADSIGRRLRDEPTVSDISAEPGAALDGGGDVWEFTLTRENANNVMRMLRHSGIPERGSITVVEPIVVVSEAAERAEKGRARASR